jgi:prolyl 4-hydroxylase
MTRIKTSFIGFFILFSVCTNLLKTCDSQSLEKQTEQESNASPPQYGADISIPVHHLRVSTNYPWLPHNVDPENNPTPEQYKDMPIQPLGDKQSFYDQFMQRWRESLIEEGADPEYADNEEYERILGNLEQPAIVVNFTSTGYTKIRAPEELRTMLTKFWEDNKEFQVEEDHQSILNQFENVTTMVSVEDENLIGGGNTLKKAVWDAARTEVSKWTNGLDLVGSSMYGIRVYKRGNLLLPHVDRLPLVCSAIINVAQDVEEPWPLEVYDRNGMAVNITMEPGDMVLYESHSLIHGRPFPLKGEYFANIFIHFEPKHEPLKKGEIPSYIRQDVSPELLEAYYTDVIADFASISEEDIMREEEEDEDDDMAEEEDDDMEEEEDDDMEEEEDDVEGEEDEEENEDYVPEWVYDIYQAASNGDIGGLHRILEEEENVKEAINRKDKHDWTPLAYAVYHGHYDAVRFLVDNGAFVDGKIGYDGNTAVALGQGLVDEYNQIVRFLSGELNESHETKEEL